RQATRYTTHCIEFERRNIFFVQKSDRLVQFLSFHSLKALYRGFDMQEMQTTLPVGSIVGDRYQIEALLGRGGFGAVYLVRDLRVRQNVFALKEIIDPDRRERRHFTLEAELLKRADHPSLPRVYRIFDDSTQNRAYLLM